MGSRFAWRRGSSGDRCENTGHTAPEGWADEAAAEPSPPPPPLLLLGDVLALDPAGEPPLIWGSAPGRAGVG